MPTFRWGSISLADCWEPLLHERVRRLRFDPVPEIDCGDCRMVKIGLFNQEARCCNYVPAIPNFLVGQILEDTPPGHETIRQWIAQGRGDPLFVNAPPRLVHLHRTAAINPLGALPCPLLDEAGGCSIYEHRPYLCVGYHCAYPEPATRLFWSCMSSLLALHSAIAAQFISEELGIERDAYVDAWNAVGSREPWTSGTSGDGFHPAFAKTLWQSETDPEDYYRRCYRYIRDHAAAMRSTIESFRREQLIRILNIEQTLTAERQQQIETESSEPAPLEPGTAIDGRFMADIIVFGNHRWTVSEHESFLLWYHAQAYSNPT